MSEPTYPKRGQESQQEQSPGSKLIKDEMLRLGQAATIGEAPTSRVYSRDYSKRDPDADQDKDTLSEFLGNPLGY